MTAIVTAMSLSFMAFNFKPDISWWVIALISFLIFMFIVFRGWYSSEHRARNLEHSKPSIVFHGYTQSISPLFGTYAYITRIMFINYPSHSNGDESTAHDLTATISVFDQQGQQVDSWDGRWANTDVPKKNGDIFYLNRIDLPANNQKVTLEIGIRFEGNKEFIGLDNLYVLGERYRKHIQPGEYKLEVTLGASNMEIRTIDFVLTIPNTGQTENNYPKLELP